MKIAETLTIAACSSDDQKRMDALRACTSKLMKMKAGGPGSGRHKVMVSNPAHNNGKEFEHDSFVSKEEAVKHSQHLMNTVPRWAHKFVKVRVVSPNA